jgi:hypothetical protein
MLGARKSWMPWIIIRGRFSQVCMLDRVLSRRQHHVSGVQAPKAKRTIASTRPLRQTSSIYQPNRWLKMSSTGSAWNLSGLMHGTLTLVYGSTARQSGLLSLGVEQKHLSRAYGDFSGSSRCLWIPPNASSTAIFWIVACEMLPKAVVAGVLNLAWCS